MKKLLPWLKSNLISVIAVVVALIAAPVMIFFSARWDAAVLRETEQRISGTVGQVRSVDTEYRIEPYLRGVEPVEVRTAPNEVTTEAVKRLFERVLDDVGRVREEAIAFNSRGKAPLIDGAQPSDRLFPQPPDQSTRFRLLNQMVEAWPRAHRELLRNHRAGTPPLEDAIRAALERIRSDEVAKLTVGRVDQNLTPQEQRDLAETLGQRRLDLYRRHARDIAFFAEPAAFAAVRPWTQTQAPPLATAWEWQMLYWVHEDIVRAFAGANSDASGNWLPVYEGPLKRVLSMTVSETGRLPSARDTGSSGGERGSGGSGGSGGGGGPGEPPMSDDDRALLELNFTQTHTGRASWPTMPNPIFDIRYVDITAIVSSRNLPRLIGAFSRINFMTVVGVSIQDYDPLPDLRQGFDYGAEHVVRATIRVETVWLRAWTRKWMPPEVRRALGVPDERAAGEPAQDETDQ